MEKKQLCEIEGEGAIRAFASICDPLFNLMEDADMQELYMQRSRPEKRVSRHYMIQQASKVLAKHEDDFCSIMAICYDTTPEEYLAKLTVTQGITDLAELMSDPVWKGFFIPAQSQETSSGSVPENTEAQTGSSTSANTRRQERSRSGKSDSSDTI